MTPSKIRQKILSERAAWIRNMLASLENLPLGSVEEFSRSRDTVAAAESYLRRSLEALFDVGRHILGKGFGVPVAEYKQVARDLADRGVISAVYLNLMVNMAGYRNRLTHFYDEVSMEELYQIVTVHREDIRNILNEFLTWQKNHPEMVDATL